MKILHNSKNFNEANYHLAFVSQCSKRSKGRKSHAQGGKLSVSKPLWRTISKQF